MPASGNIIDFTENYTNNYNSLQAQLNRRIGRLQWSANYTFSRTIVYNNNSQTALLQLVNTQLTKNVTNRRTPSTSTSATTCPTASKSVAQRFHQGVLDGWHLNGNGAIYAGTPFTVGCSATSAALADIGRVRRPAVSPFRCQMGNTFS